MPELVSEPKSLFERGEKLLSVAAVAAASNLPGHRGASAINASTIYRWITRGVKTPGGVIRLEADRLGNGWRTSLEALARFTERLTAASLPSADTSAAAPSTPTPKARSRAAARASQELDDLLG